MKIDPYNHKKYYLRWKEENKEGISGISKANSKIILQYIYDMEHGLNVASGSKKEKYFIKKKDLMKLQTIYL